MNAGTIKKAATKLEIDPHKLIVNKEHDKYTIGHHNYYFNMGEKETMTADQVWAITGKAEADLTKLANHFSSKMGYRSFEIAR